jgi:hypothetical protein
VVSRRHHLRIWKTDFTVDGTPIWAGAATHDVAIEIAKRGHLINHRIDPAVDAERDFIGANLTLASSVSGQKYLRSGDPVFQGQTTSGETYHSDSRILLLDLQPVTSANNSEPGQTTAVLRVISLPVPAPTESFRTKLDIASMTGWAWRQTGVAGHEQTELRWARQVAYQHLPAGISAPQFLCGDSRERQLSYSLRGHGLETPDLAERVHSSYACEKSAK